MSDRTNRRATRGIRVAGAIAAAGLALGSALVGASPASADTPYLSCNRGTGGSFGSYYGWASCTGSGVWRVRTDCYLGLTYRSPWVIQVDSTEIARAGSCYWGVSAVTVEHG